MNAPNTSPSPLNSKVVVEVNKTPSSIEISAVDHTAGWKLSFSQGPVSVVKDEKLTLQTVIGGIAMFLAAIAGFPGAPKETGSLTDHIESVHEDFGPAPEAVEAGSSEALRNELELAGKLNAEMRAELEAIKAQGVDPAVRAENEALKAELEAMKNPPAGSVHPADEDEPPVAPVAGNGE